MFNGSYHAIIPCHASLVGRRISLIENCATGLNGQTSERNIGAIHSPGTPIDRKDEGGYLCVALVTSRETSARVSVVFSRNAIKAILTLDLMLSSPFASISAVRLDDTQDSSSINSTSCLQKGLDTADRFRCDDDRRSS